MDPQPTQPPDPPPPPPSPAEIPDAGVGLLTVAYDQAAALDQYVLAANIAGGMARVFTLKRKLAETEVALGRELAKRAELEKERNALACELDKIKQTQSSEAPTPAPEAVAVPAAESAPPA